MFQMGYERDLVSFLEDDLVSLLDYRQDFKVHCASLPVVVVD